MQQNFGKIENAIFGNTDPTPHIYKLSDFSIYKTKSDGISSGGFYQDQTGTQWLIKEPQFGLMDAAIREFVAGGIYQHYLGKYAPEVILIHDEANNSIKLGSKMIDNFTTLNDFSLQNGWISNTIYPTGAIVKDGTVQYGDPHTPTEIDGKTVGNFANTISTIVFLNDTDAHAGNVGIVEEGNSFEFAKIDHGFALDNLSNTPTLYNIKAEVSNHYYYENIDKIGYENLYDAVQMIAKTPTGELTDIIEDKMQEFENYLKVIHADDLDTSFQFWFLQKNLETQKENLNHDLAERIEAFKDIAYHMEVEKAVLDADLPKLKMMLDNGLDANESFHPFFSSLENPTYHWRLNPFNHTTAFKLAEENHNEQVLDLFAANTPKIPEAPSLAEVISTQTHPINDFLDIGDHQLDPVDIQHPAFMPLEHQLDWINFDQPLFQT